MVASGLLAAATGLLGTDPGDDRFIDFWAPEFRNRFRLVLAGVHLVVGVLGAAAAIGLEWVPVETGNWWPTNAAVFAAASVAVFRADVSGFKLGTATTGRSMLRLLEDWARSRIDRRIDRNIGELAHDTTDKNLIVAAFMVMEKTFKGEIGYRELTDDISQAEKVLDPKVSLAGAPSAEKVRAWLRSFVTDQIKAKQLVIDRHQRWSDARDEWRTGDYP